MQDSISINPPLDIAFCVTGDSLVNERDVELGRCLLQQREKGFTSFCGVGVQFGEWLTVRLFLSEDRHGTETKGAGIPSPWCRFGALNNASAELRRSVALRYQKSFLPGIRVVS
jgi:hypothetical protein